MTYRARARRCPGGHGPMRVVRVAVGGELVEVDACDVCGGVFVEFFDGEPRGIARALRPKQVAVALGSPPRCPDCDVEMAPHFYLGDGPALHRCGSCMGLFASPATLRDLARYTLTDDRPAPSTLLEWMFSKD